MITRYTIDGDATEPKPEPVRIKYLAATSSIDVAGADLSRIQNLFHGFPFHLTEEPQIWTGDYARYVLANLHGISELPLNDGLTAYTIHGKPILTWKTGERLPGTSQDIISNTEYITVNYTEMPWILSRMRNIPYVSDAKQQIWCGDLARFIVAQLPAEDGQQE